jgi:hypothetical protein
MAPHIVPSVASATIAQAMRRVSESAAGMERLAIADFSQRFCF